LALLVDYFQGIVRFIADACDIIPFMLADPLMNTPLNAEQA
jgi:hypothetical protein